MLADVRAGWKKAGIVVNGPWGIGDDVRVTVVSVGRQEKTVFNLKFILILGEWTKECFVS